MKNRIIASPYAAVFAVLCNVVLAFVVYMACRVVYVCENWTLFSQGWSMLKLSDLVRGGLRFDASAIAYTNSLYALLMLLPIFPKEKRWWRIVTRWLFVVVNSVAVIVNLIDAVYSQYTGRRTTATVFHEFSNEGNLGNIFFAELTNHWYLVLVGVVLIAVLWFLYIQPHTKESEVDRPFKIRYYIVQSVCFVLIFPIAVIAMRGGATRAVRPIAISNANQYVNHPHEAAIVLNTPFSVIRTIGKTTFENPHYFDDAQCHELFYPVYYTTADTIPMNKKNVVVIIVESLGREYIGFYNHHLDNGTYKGYTPFLDSLIQQSLTWERTFANGRKSIDAMPSILSSIPMFVEPFFVTNYSLNRVGGLAAELSSVGYYSAFFHGADNGSMGFQAFARSTKFKDYYGRTEFDADTRFGGEKEFDGTWAIWDEPFLQFFACKMSEMPQPFVTTVFTASSHHPFVIPEQYKERYPEEEMVMHKCIRYTDNALRRFFSTASRQPWFKNTLFVITGDHTNMSNHAEYKSSIGVFGSPIIIFDPSGELPRTVMHGVAQQIDVMPTVLSLLHYPGSYVAFGKDLLATNADSSWIVNYNSGVYQYLERDTLVQLDGNGALRAYDLKNDTLLRQPLEQVPLHHENRVKAIIQEYMSRMINNELMLDRD